ncbi:hypothetical protein QQG55_55485 [Brugia pahangi]
MYRQLIQLNAFFPHSFSKFVSKAGSGCVSLEVTLYDIPGGGDDVAVEFRMKNTKGSIVQTSAKQAIEVV